MRQQSEAERSSESAAQQHLRLPLLLLRALLLALQLLSAPRPPCISCIVSAASVLTDAAASTRLHSPTLTLTLTNPNEVLLTLSYR